MRTFKRLLPCLMVLVLLAGVAPARPAGVTRTNHSLGVGVSKPQFNPGYHHPPTPPRLYFGTVVRDTSDEQSVGPGRWQSPQETSLCGSFFIWNWFSLLISR